MQAHADAARRRLLQTILACVAAPRAADALAQAPGAAAADFAGTWSGDLAHAGQRTTLWLQIEPDAQQRLAARLHVPVIHVYDLPLGPVTVDGDRLKMQLFTFALDAAAGTLRADIPTDVVPVYPMHVTMRRAARFARPPRPAIEAPVVEPRWSVDTGAPAWADVVAFDGRVFAANDAGRLVALDARTGATAWSFAAGAAIRARPTIAGALLYAIADDGWLHALDRRTGAEAWKLRIADRPVVRVPPSDPKSRHDVRGAAVTAGQQWLYVATHDGRVLAIDPLEARRNGGAAARRWEFATKDLIVAAPELAGGRVFAGSYDGRIYALDARTGRPAWSFDTRQPVTSTPVHVALRTRGIVLAGSRSYDLFGLDAATGAVAWNRYLWFSWIESTPVLRDGIAYVGSSDGAIVQALDAANGQSLWETDVHGMAWGTPALAGARLCIGTRGGRPRHAAHALALDAARGRIAWRHTLEPPEGADRRAPWGFAGSPAIDGGLAFFPALDGKVYAFDV